MAKFDLGDRFRDVLADVSDSDTTLEKININLLDSDEKNFYSLGGIDELAANIELIGLQQPIRVRVNPDMPGRYFIVSGHRRRAALWKLYEENPEKWGTVPCIVESDTVSPAMQELRLIYANSDTRRMSDADLAKQAERVTELLYQLKEEGVEFPGRMRDHVAEACKVSATKLAMLKVIQEKLENPFAEQFQSGIMPTQTAYALARLPMEIQWGLGEKLKGQIPHGHDAERAVQRYEELEASTATCPNKEKCHNLGGRIFAICKPNNYVTCVRGNDCCRSCFYHSSCQGCCDIARAESKQRTADNKKAEEQRKAKADAEIAERQKVYREKSIAASQRVVRAADALGLDDKTEIPFGYGYERGHDLKTARKYAAGEFKENHYFYKIEYYPATVESLRDCMDLLHCSADYLLGLTDELQPTAAAAPEWKDGAPEAGGTYIVKIDDGSKKPKLQVMKWRACQWHYPSSGGILVGGVLGWYKIPEV